MTTTILIAEDNPVNRELIRELLELEGYKVLEVENGEDAFNRVIASPPDLVLADIQMPVLDGFGFVSRVRHHKQVHSLPVIALTAYAMEGDREKALARGFNGYVTKPVERKVLLAEIRRCLSENVSSHSSS